MKKTLLERAVSVKVRTSRQKLYKYNTEELVELSIAWMKRDIGVTQANIALGFSQRGGSNALYYIATGLREAYRQGKLINKK